jgi:hypothetical protein
MTFGMEDGRCKRADVIVGSLLCITLKIKRNYGKEEFIKK